MYGWQISLSVLSSDVVLCIALIIFSVPVFLPSFIDALYFVLEASDPARVHLMSAVYNNFYQVELDRSSDVMFSLQGNSTLVNFAKMSELRFNPPQTKY